jgi:putative PEP-CTERM system TPR-repeat lipoprotein
MEANNVVDELLLSGAGADLPMLLAAADAASLRQQNAAVSRLLGKAAILAPTNQEVLLRRANLAFAERKYDEATAVLNDMLRQEPGNTGAQLALARVAEARGDVAGSRKALDAAVTAHPAAMEPSLMLASLELRASKVEAASKVLDNLVNANTDASVPNAAGLLLARAGRHEEARTRFRQALDRANNAEYWFNLGNAQLALKDSASARQSFVHSAELQPDSLRAGYAAVRLSLEQKEIETARRVADGLVTKLPDSPTSWLLLGEVDAAAGDNAAAVTAFSRSYAARPSSLAATQEFGARVAAGAQRPEEPLLKWLAREPTDTVARLQLADFHLRNGRDAEAREQLEIIVKQAPNDLAALNNLAWVLRLSAPDRAEALAKRARAIAPDNSAVADTLGVILLANGKTEEAVKVLAQAAGAMPADQTVQYHYASSLSKMGQKDKARGILENVLKDQQGFPDRVAAQRLFEELG